MILIPSQVSIVLIQSQPFDQQKSLVRQFYGAPPSAGDPGIFTPGKSLRFSLRVQIPFN